MFIGSLPKKLITQILNNIKLKDRVYVGCSGSFKTEHAIKTVMPEKFVSGNDVSLLSCSVGKLLVGERLDVKFTGRIEPLNDLLGDAIDNVAAVCLSTTLARFKGNNQYCHSHFDHIIRNLRDYHRTEREKINRYIDGFTIDDFFQGDFRQQIVRAKENDGTIMMFAPTYKGGYEQIYKFISENSEWIQPHYDIWDPDNVEALIEELIIDKQDFAIVADKRLNNIEPRIMFAGGNKPIYLYAHEARSSIRIEAKKSQPFKYKPIDPDKITEDSKIEIKILNGQQLNFLKDVYLAKGINHKTGMINFAVFIDGMLAGAFIFSYAQFGDKLKEIYMLSDFSTSRHRKISKLIPMLATSRSVIDLINRKYMIAIESVYTTAFTDKPVSMKYRGIFDLAKRGEGFLNYSSKVREATPQEVFKIWYQKYGH
ncbi:hypothetical protein LPW36_02030 [Jinshanibacter sp. LJY008]|uniref:Uncharacterized protein n=1 Tax=Limnobaculum eriocheiris TaxID=2897391 RepID=A0A9X1MUF0_9GAMM|nr:hypothetical protein [Limnobaculum eriocheiris]MCD1124823.1 hypothetical protein [Limnobaculum eriocheiris]